MLANVPAELLLHIIAFLDQNDLAQLRLVSTKLKEAAHNAFFGRLELDYSRNCSFSDILQAVQTKTQFLIQNDQIARTVKLARLQNSAGPFKRFLEIIRQMKSAPPSQRTGMLEQEKAMSGYVKELEDAVARLLDLCPNLQDLSVSSALTNLHGCLRPHLRSLAYWSNYDVFYECWPVFFRPELIKSMSALQGLETLLLGGRDLPERSLNWPSDLPKLESLKTLHLCPVQVTEKTLGRILHETPNLESLTLLLTWRADPQEGEARDPFLNCVKLGIALGNRDAVIPNNATESKEIGLLNPSKLRYLTIMVDWVTNGGTALEYGGGGDRQTSSEDEQVEWGIRGTIGSLKHLSNLGFLEISPAVLFGWQPDLSSVEELPMSLQYLHLRDDMGTWSKKPDPYRYAVAGQHVAEGVSNLSRCLGASLQSTDGPRMLHSLTLLHAENRWATNDEKEREALMESVEDMQIRLRVHAPDLELRVKTMEPNYYHEVLAAEREPDDGILEMRLPLR